MLEAVEFAPRGARAAVHEEEMARPHHGWGHDEYSPRQIEDDRSFPAHRYAMNKDQQRHDHHQVAHQQRHHQAHHHQTRELVHLPAASSLLTPISPPPPLPPPPPRAVPLSAVVTATASVSYARRPSYHGDYATPSPVGQTQPQMLASSGDQHPMSGPVQQRRPVDLGLSPTHSSISSSDRSDELELARYQTKACSSSMSSCSSPSSSAAAVSVAALGAPFAAVNAITPHNARLPDRTPFSKSNMANYDPRNYPRRSSGSTAAPNTGINLPPVQPQQQQPTYSSPSPSLRSHASSPKEPNQMSILSLLSSHTDDVAGAAPAPDLSPSRSKAAIPPPFAPLSPAAHSDYRIVVRQQPVAARSCGFGERDRRVIDPPPIVQLVIDDPNASREELDRRLDSVNCAVIHCTIWSEAGDEDYSSMPEDFRSQRRLMGSLVGSPFIGFDEHGKKGCFFCFPDLSCRTPGTFRLKFSLVVINPALDRIPGAKKPITATCLTDVFTVYNAKDFPGMQASTALTKRLKEQGCLISIKKGNDKTNARAHHSGSDDDNDGEDDDNEDGGGGPGSSGKGKGKARKKQRTKL